MGKGSKSSHVKSGDKRNSEKTKKKLLEIKLKNDKQAPTPIVKSKGDGSVHGSGSTTTTLQGTTKLVLCKEDEATILKFLALLNHGNGTGNDNQNDQKQKLNNIINIVDDNSDEDSDRDSDEDSNSDSDSDSDADYMSFNKIVDELCDNSNNDYNDDIFDAFEGSSGSGGKSKKEKKQEKEDAKAPTEAFKRMLIRDDRLNSRNDIVVDANQKRLTNSKNERDSDTNDSKKSSKTSSSTSSSKSKSKSKPLGEKIRFDVSCEKKSDTKMFVVSRDTSNIDLLTQIRKKFNLSSASNMKKFNSFRVVVSIKGGVYEDFYNLSEMSDGVHLQICHSPMGLGTTPPVRVVEPVIESVEVVVEVVEPKVVEIIENLVEMDTILLEHAEPDGQSENEEEADAEVESESVSSSSDPALSLSLSTIMGTINNSNSDANATGGNAGDALSLPPPPPVPIFISPPPTNSELQRSRVMREAHVALTNTSKYQDILSDRCRLPIYDAKQQILSALRTNQVIVVCGETGSGKVGIYTI